ncbi:helix-turn-helix domain-containing protein [Streptomyces sp. DSM 44917]|uniref:Helix-turn-helix domain-containing protein n=1 Tax=Streptomyces boetiae TaxID=3075541 RepID=A0ABU2LD17_9ACTN|nr:helix-turn-helix domain-containing protein [Streptomyces sp. DSM 44917]MDT0309474.1 helix-turn-helix domain-containing protein [Streptomyces sp. DSM 44917]
MEDHLGIDARGLRALAHPVRVRLLGLLRAHGPATATGLAHRTGLTSGATSYHLRRLADAGLVAEDTARGNARERWWRAVHRAPRPGERDLAGPGSERDPAGPEAALSRLGPVAAAQALRVQQGLAELETMAPAWRRAFGLGDVRLLLTPGEAERLRGELRELLARYPREEEGAPGPPGAARVTVITQLVPEPDPEEAPGLDPGNAPGPARP